MDHGISCFDEMMILPFWYYAKKLDKRNFSCCLTISREFGFSLSFILSKLAGFVIRVVILRNKM